MTDFTNPPIYVANQGPDAGVSWPPLFSCLLFFGTAIRAGISEEASSKGHGLFLALTLEKDRQRTDVLFCSNNLGCSCKQPPLITYEAFDIRTGK